MCLMVSLLNVIPASIHVTHVNQGLQDQSNMSCDQQNESSESCDGHTEQPAGISLFVVMNETGSMLTYEGQLPSSKTTLWSRHSHLKVLFLKGSHVGAISISPLP